MGTSSGTLIRELTAPAAAPDFDRLIARRAAHEPLAYILGWREFWSLPFRVSPATLIPRPETETVVEAALALLPRPASPRRILDLGTGTGCLLLAFLHERPGAFGIGVDRSESAAHLARRNARDLGLAARSAFLCGDWAGAIGGRFDLVMSNPPYVATADLAALMPEVAAYEPRAGVGWRPGRNDGLSRHSRRTAAASCAGGRGGAGAWEWASIDARRDDCAEASGFRSEARFDLSRTARAMIRHPSP